MKIPETDFIFNVSYNQNNSRNLNDSVMKPADSGQSRAAALMNAARRSHFVENVQKYEAKVKQEQARRALLKEKRGAVVPLKEQQSTSWQSSELPLLPKSHVTMENVTNCVSENESCSEGVFDCVIRMNKMDVAGDVASSKRDRSPRVTPVVEDDPIAIPVGARFQLKPCQEVLTPAIMKPLAAFDVDIADIASALKIKIKKANMARMMQEHAFLCARECLLADKLMSKETAYTLKKEFDGIYGPAWHCIVGKSFGSYVTHSVGGFIYFSLGKISILLFKTTVELVGH